MNNTMHPTAQKCLAYIQSYTAAYGFPPTIREIADAVGVASTSTVEHHLRELECTGHIARRYNAARAIRVLRPTPWEVAP